jgi:hypothetical protein
MLYAVVVTLHSWVRWIALLLGLASTISALGDRNGLDERPRGARWDVFFMAAVDVQVLLGLLLYLGLSPFTREGLADLSAAMRTPALRFWTVDHLALMFATVVLVRLGRVLALTARSAARRRTRRLVCFSLALALMLAGTPWPGSSQGRPLLRRWPSAERDAP